MTRTLLLTAVVFAALSLAACNKPASTTAADATRVAQAATDKTQDAMGAAVGQASATTLGSHDTGAFVSNASQSDMYEIQAAQIAQARSKTFAVKGFAKMMVADHTALTAAMIHTHCTAEERHAVSASGPSRRSD